MTIELTPELQEIISRELASGRYRSEQEVIAQGLRLLEERAIRLAELRREIDVGLEELARGEGVRFDSRAELDAFFEDVINRGRQRVAPSIGSPCSDDLFLFS